MELKKKLKKNKFFSLSSGISMPMGQSVGGGEGMKQRVDVSKLQMTLLQELRMVGAIAGGLSQ